MTLTASGNTQSGTTLQVSFDEFLPQLREHLLRINGRRYNGDRQDLVTRVLGDNGVYDVATAERVGQQLALACQGQGDRAKLAGHELQVLGTGMNGQRQTIDIRITPIA